MHMTLGGLKAFKKKKKCWYVITASVPFKRSRKKETSNEFFFFFLFFLISASPLQCSCYCSKLPWPLEGSTHTHTETAENRRVQGQKMQRLRPKRVAKLAATVAGRSADAHLVDYSSRLLSKNQTGQNVWNKSFSECTGKRVQTWVFGLHVCTRAAGSLLLDDRNTRCAALEIRSQIRLKMKKKKVSFDWKFECYVRCCMFSDQVAVHPQRKFLHVALTGCKIFYNHVTRCIPFGRERINAVNIFFLPLTKLR